MVSVSVDLRGGGGAQAAMRWAGGHTIVVDRHEGAVHLSRDFCFQGIGRSSDCNQRRSDCGGEYRAARLHEFPRVLLMDDHKDRRGEQLLTTAVRT